MSGEAVWGLRYSCGCIGLPVGPVEVSHKRRSALEIDGGPSVHHQRVLVLSGCYDGAPYTAQCFVDLCEPEWVDVRPHIEKLSTLAATGEEAIARQWPHTLAWWWCRKAWAVLQRWRQARRHAA